MKKLSDQLVELASRTTKLEDSVSAAQDQDRQRLVAQRHDLIDVMTTAKARADQDAATAGAAASSWWTATRGSADQWFAGVRGKRAELRAEHDASTADRVAQDAEIDAADAVDFALYAIDTAEYALIDAALAREDADTLMSAENR